MSRTGQSRRRSASRRRFWALRVFFLFLLMLVLAGLLWCRWVLVQIDYYAHTDEAAPSDAIAIFGAAEYNGRPSPVYRARLDHALSLYRRGMAPLLITLGGDGGDNFTEGGVGRSYLIGMGVPEHDIIAETVSRNSVESAERVAVIARANGMRRLLVVSDGSHLFRIHEICTANGLTVLTSPRPRVAIEGGGDDGARIRHEIASYTFWRLHLR